MNSKILKFVAFLASTTALQASVTLNVSIENIQDSTGADVTDGMLAVLVISTADSAFGSVKAGTLAMNNSATDTEFIDNVDDALFVAFPTSTNGFSGTRQAVTTQNFNIDSRFSPGDPFAIYWFPTVAFNSDLSSINLTAGTEYGIVSSGQVDFDGTGTNGVKNWVIPADGNSTNYNQANAGAATFRVVAVVPEPTSTALLGLGGLSLLMRRRRA